MKYLATADLHLTDRKRDEYRWAIFPWLKELAAVREVDAIFILGDLTHEKDRHPASLVNRVVDSLRSLAVNCVVYVIKGNHDYKDPVCPFFRFLDEEGVVFITQPREERFALPRGGPFIFWCFPHSDDLEADLLYLERNEIGTPELMLCHQTFEGSRMSNGIKLDHGTPSNFFGSQGYRGAVVLSGDVHIRQKVGEVLYVGAPYPINFGDTYKPRVLFWNDGNLHSLRVPSIKKLKVTVYDPEELDGHELQEGDQVKLVVSLHRRDFGLYAEHRQLLLEKAHRLGVEVFSVELRERNKKQRKKGADQRPTTTHRVPAQVLQGYCSEFKVDDGIRDAGMGVLDEA